MTPLTSDEMIIRSYRCEDESAIIELWRKCNLVRFWNNPEKDITRKLSVNPEMFLVGQIGGKPVATMMGGYEGHRGWIYYLAVDPAYQRQGFGRQIMEAIEEKILATGCPKINLMVRHDNLEAVKFYEKLGYNTDEVVSMGKRLVADDE
jgi:ribosomal protein S18 acetylase RimI-like enzyme